MSLLDIETGDEQIDGMLQPDEFLAKFRAEKPEVIAFDTESPTYKWHLPHAFPFSLQFSWDHANTYFVPCRKNGELDKAAAELLFEVLATTPTVVGHHIKYDLHVAKRLLDPFGIPLIVRTIHDTMILDAVLDEARHHGLKERCTTLGISYDDRDADDLKEKIKSWIEEASEMRGSPQDYADVPKRLMVPYALQDAYLTLELFRYLQTDLEEQIAGAPKMKRDLRDIYNLELRVLWVLFQMEERGMRIDLDFVLNQINKLTPQLELTRLKLTTELGFEMNPGSTDDVATALRILGHEDAIWINPKTGKVNLPDWRMEQLAKEPTAGPLVRQVLEYRTNSKMLSSYFETLAYENEIDETGQAIIRCNNKQMGARTGRMSVTEPALQTIPREKGEVRGAFIAREGHKLLFADYSQQELRVLAHYMALVGDRSVKVIFEEGTIDLHQETAAAIFSVSYEAVTKSMRNDGKQTNFAIVYGAGIKKIAAMHGVDEDTAKQRLYRLYSRFPGLQKLKQTTQKAMIERKYVVTAFGRRHREKEGKYAYKAVNSLVQGTSADVTKAAMVRIDDAFRTAGMRAMILLAVHDEIIVEAPLDEVNKASQIIEDAMRDVPEIQVPMEVEINVATRWSEAK